ncbi:glutathione S-transferase P 1-like [Pleurodeles waltl]|uniref:glutathione S-transferase P 1-like n=1 Tax=Pleurodeles waltl TaxID=8319 RepID=UPI0037098BDF
MAQYTITYFNLRGRTETMRFLLADQGCEWKDDFLSIQDWYDGKVELKKTAVFGQLPMLADDDFILFQSNAILRYLGRKHDLYGKNPKEAALIDMANDGLEDLRQKFYKFFFYEWDTAKEKYMEDLPNQLRPFERFLSQNSSGFLVGSTVSFADYNLLDVLQSHLIWAPDCLNNFPHLKAFKEKMESRPKLKAYLQSNDHKNRLLHPTRKL